MKVEYLVIHCSASNRSTTTVEAIKRWHTDPKPRGNGWDDIGYHKLIDITGKVHQGRPDTQQGAHEPYFNRRSLGICVIGHFDVDRITEHDPQFKALVQVLATLCKRYGVPVEKIVGHRDAYAMQGQSIKKTCPGKNLYALFPRLRELVAEYL